MILLDTSVWIDHFRQGDPGVVSLLESGDVLCHPFIIGELACSNLASRKEVLHRLALLPSAASARHPEVLAFIEAHRLSGLGLGFIDMHLLAAANLDGFRLWTRDKALRKAAEKLKVAY
ncbi:MAG TPA: type II toxin-antitoxin system VapC family toxin [Fibrobacteria bacterium]|nr:type II toxin-antitoxin system VapC family toxin [Fibrobacteria bacterium]